MQVPEPVAAMIFRREGRGVWSVAVAVLGGNLELDVGALDSSWSQRRRSRDGEAWVVEMSSPALV